MIRYDAHRWRSNDREKSAMVNSFNFLGRFLISVLPILFVVLVAKNKRGDCTLTLEVAKKQIVDSIFIIVLSQMVIFTPAKPLSPLALLFFALEVYGVYRLARAIYRKRDLTRAATAMPAVSAR